MTMFRTLLLTSTVALAFAGPALADPNTTNSLNITQVNGSNDVANVTQIGGLTAAQLGGNATNSAPNTAKIVQNGSNNTVTLDQDSTTTVGGGSNPGAGSIATILQTNQGDGTGETATVTQTPGLGDANIDNAYVRQIGQSDQATITQGAQAVTLSATIAQGSASTTSYNNAATILQGTAYGDNVLGFDNATITQGINGSASNSTATVTQDGNYDNASISQGGNSSQATATITQGQTSYNELARISQGDVSSSQTTITQSGNTDQASATQLNGTNDNIWITQSSTSTNSVASVTQNGSFDSATINQTGAADSIAVTQTGNNHSVNITQK